MIWKKQYISWKNNFQSVFLPRFLWKILIIFNELKLRKLRLSQWNVLSREIFHQQSHKYLARYILIKTRIIDRDKFQEHTLSLQIVFFFKIDFKTLLTYLIQFLFNLKSIGNLWNILLCHKVSPILLNFIFHISFLVSRDCIKLSIVSTHVHLMTVAN